MELFNTRVTIYTKSAGTTNATGEAEEAWVAVSGGTDIKARIQPYKSSIRAMTPGMTISATHKIFIQPAVDVQNGDKVIDKDSQEYIVSSSKDWTWHITCEARLL